LSVFFLISPQRAPANETHQRAYYGADYLSGSFHPGTYVQLRPNQPGNDCTCHEYDQHDSNQHRKYQDNYVCGGAVGEIQEGHVTGRQIYRR
jgi:hypothetical protein